MFQNSSQQEIQDVRNDPSINNQWKVHAIQESVIKNNQVFYVCNQCGRGFLRKPTLDGHMKSKHNTEGRLQCKKCDKSFASRRAILLHAQSKHDMIKFKCDACSHQSSQLGNLKTHIKKKHNEKN